MRLVRADLEVLRKDNEDQNNLVTEETLLKTNRDNSIVSQSATNIFE